MPFPHLSHNGTFCTLPVPVGIFVTGAFTLLIPVGRPSKKQDIANYLQCNIDAPGYDSVLCCNVSTSLDL